LLQASVNVHVLVITCSPSHEPSDTASVNDASKLEIVTGWNVPTGIGTAQGPNDQLPRLKAEPSGPVALFLYAHPFS